MIAAWSSGSAVTETMAGKTAPILADVGQFVDVFDAARGLEGQRVEARRDRRSELAAQYAGAGCIPQASIPAPFPPVTLLTTRVTPPGGDTEYYGVPLGMATAGMRLVLHIDNNPCEAVINPISSSGFTTSDNNCGFYIYPNNATAVNVPFKARHRNNFATFSFNTFRGSGNVVPVATASGRVGSSANDFTPDSDSNYTKSIPVGTLLTNTEASLPPSTCTKAAFSETLHVQGMATNGWPGALYAADGVPHAYALSNT